MTTRVLRVALLAVFAAVSLNGCVVALGNRDSGATKSNPTLGKQLTDLKQARDSGALTEEEYQAAKKRLVEAK